MTSTSMRVFPGSDIEVSALPGNVKIVQVYSTFEMRKALQKLAGLPCNPCHQFFVIQLRDCYECLLSLAVHS